MLTTAAYPAPVASSVPSQTGPQKAATEAPPVAAITQPVQPLLPLPDPVETQSKEFVYEELSDEDDLDNLLDKASEHGDEDEDNKNSM